MNELDYVENYHSLEPFEHEEMDTVPLESQCIECGDEAVGMCSCCGSNLCVMHEEIQAGFCSNFTTTNFSKGDVVKVWSNELDVEKGSKIRFLESVEVSGCFTEIKGEYNELVVMASEPDEKPELVRDNLKVVN